tara:strand:+ start:152 stop:982 length:831 start_codon:yes stop_codon:yes gene_type:complete
MEIDGTDDDSKEVDELSRYWGSQEYTLEKWDGTLPDGEICQHGWGNDIPKCSAKAEVALVRPGIADLDEFTVAQLKDSLRREGLPDSGTKAELVARLVEVEDGVHHAPAVKNALAAFKKGDFAVAAEKLDFVVENLERVWQGSWAETIVTRYSYFCEEHAVWEREHRRLFQLYEDYAEELFGTIQNDLSLDRIWGCLQPQEAERIMAGEITVEETVLASALFSVRFDLEDILRDCKELGFEGDCDYLKGTAEFLRILEEVDIPSTSLTKRSLSDDF